MVLESYELVMRQSSWISEIVTATTAGDALALASERNFQLACLDIDLPDMDGFELSGKLNALNPGLRTIAVTSFQEPYVLYEVRRSPYFIGYVGKTEASSNILLEAVDTVCRGHQYYSPSVAQRYEEDRERVRIMYHQLTPNDLEYCSYMAAGLADEEIAAHLGRSVHTVRGQRSKLVRRLQINGSRELTAAALRLGLVRPSQIESIYKAVRGEDPIDIFKP